MAYQNNQADHQLIIKRQKELSSPKVVESFKAQLGNGADNFIAGLNNAVAQYPDLAKTNLGDLVTVAKKVASLNLSLVSEMGQAYIIPYNNRRENKVEAQLQLGYRGIIQLVQNTGKIGRISGSPVYVGNKPHYNFVFGDFSMENEDFNPYTSTSKEDKEVAGYVAYYYLKTGERVVNYWPIERVEEHAKKFSPSYKGKGGKGYTPWYTNFDAMAIKTVMKDLLKFAPKSTESEELLAEDNKREREVVDVTNDAQEENTKTIESVQEPEPVADEQSEKVDPWKNSQPQEQQETIDNREPMESDTLFTELEDLK